MLRIVEFDAVTLGVDQPRSHGFPLLQANDYNVPGDVAITGFDNLFETTIAYPPLTTVHVHKP